MEVRIEQILLAPPEIIAATPGEQTILVQPEVATAHHAELTISALFVVIKHIIGPQPVIRITKTIQPCPNPPRVTGCDTCCYPNPI